MDLCVINPSVYLKSNLLQILRQQLEHYQQTLKADLQTKSRSSLVVRRTRYSSNISFVTSLSWHKTSSSSSLKTQIHSISTQSKTHQEWLVNLWFQKALGHYTSAYSTDVLWLMICHFTFSLCKRKQKDPMKFTNIINKSELIAFFMADKLGG